MKMEKEEKDNPDSSTVDEVDQVQSASQSPDTTTASSVDKEPTDAPISPEAKSDSSKKLDEVESTVANSKCSPELMDVENDDSSKLIAEENLDQKKNEVESTTESSLAKVTARKSTAGKLKSLSTEAGSSSDNQELSDNASKPSENVSNTSEVFSKPGKKYIYKLKAKSGKILRYTSMVPIVLKRPIIKLDKMAEINRKKLNTNQTDEMDSDNSSKENHGKSNMARSTIKRRGRPPSSQKLKLAIAAREERKSNTDDVKSSTYAMQTRKRQLKFLPDGRLVSPGEKKPKMASSDEDANNKIDEDKSDLSYNESDAADESDSSIDRKSRKSTVTTSKKFSPLERKLADKSKPKKEFDFESYLREKTGKTRQKSPEKMNSTMTSSKKLQTTTNGTSATNASKSTIETVKKSAVDPAQLLSSLIGVTVLPSQLNVVKFVPKVIHERKNITSTSSTLKKITLDKLTSKGSVVTTQKAPFKFVSKTTGLTTTTAAAVATSSTSLPKILPKPTNTVTTTLTTPVRKPIERQLFTPSSSFRQFSSIAPKPTVNATSTPLQTIKSNQTNDSSASKENNMPKFDNYTDTRRVYTKNGPKKLSMQTQGGGDSCRTVYDLMERVFDQMPSWNLHVIPDTNTFCIAQVSRGRMGLPALVKSIELNECFYAKVYVHQLHCKRFDGVYDSESKILSLIREIDALAA